MAGIAALIEASSHHRDAYRAMESGLGEHVESIEPGASGLSQTAYDLLRIGGWALVIFGVVLVVLGLIAYRAEQAKAAGSAS